MILRVLALVTCLPLTVGACQLVSAPTTPSTNGTPPGETTKLPPPKTVPSATEAGTAGSVTGLAGLQMSGAVTGTGSGAVVTPGAPSQGTTEIGGTPGTASARGLPADMLSPEEITRARDLALGVDAVQGMVASAADRDEVVAAQGRGAEEGELSALLANRPTYRVMIVERAPIKDGQDRVANVMIYRYDTGEATIAQVDLTSGEVQVQGVPAPYPIPVVPAEIDEAATVARANPDVRARLEASGLDPDTTPANGLLTVTTNPGSPCTQHRCLRLFFSSQERPVPEFSTIVDMVTMQVVEVAPIPGGSLNP